MEKVNKSLANNCVKILIGSSVSIFISIISFCVFSAILTNTDVREETIPPVILIISLISILIGSSISSKRISKKGIINGGIVGLIYISILYVLSSIILVGFKLNLYSVIMMVGSTISGIIGGIIGVNSSKN